MFTVVGLFLLGSLAAACALLWLRPLHLVLAWQPEDFMLPGLGLEPRQ